MDKKSKVLKRKQPIKKSERFLSPEREERNFVLKQNILSKSNLNDKSEQLDQQPSHVNILHQFSDNNQFSQEKPVLNNNIGLSPINNYKKNQITDIFENQENFKFKKLQMQDNQIEPEPDQDEELDGLQQKFEITEDEFPEFDDLQLNFLLRLALFCKSLAGTCKKINQYFDEISQNLNLKLKNKNIPSLIFLYLSFIIVMIVFISLTIDGTQLTSPVGYTDLQKYIADNLAGGGILFTFYGIFFMQFGNKIIFILLFCFQAVPGLAIFVNIMYVTYVTKKRNMVNQTALVTSVYFFSMYFFWLSAFIIKNDLKKYLNEKTKNIFLILWCIVPGAIIIGYTAYSISINFDLNFEWGQELLNVLGAPYIIMISLLWAYVHFSFLDPLLKKLQSQETNNSRETHLTEDSGSLNRSNSEVELQNLSDLTKSVNFTKSLYLGRKKGVSFFRIYFNNYIVLFTSFAFGIPMIICTLLCLFYISNCLTPPLEPITQFNNPQAFYMGLFMIICVPFYVIVGIILIYCDYDTKEKLIIIPILGAVIPVILTMPLSNAIDNFKELHPLKQFFAFGPSVVSLYWITLIYLRTNYWKLSMLFNSYVSFFFFLPIFYIIPLRGVNMYNTFDNAAEIIEYSLIIFGGVFFSIIWILDLVITVVRNWVLHLKTINKRRNFGEDEAAEEFISAERFELQQIFKYDLEYFGLWGNSLGCIMTFTILAFMYFNQIPSITQVQKGIFIGLQVTIIYLFLCCILILTLKIAPPQSKENLSFSEQVASIFGKHEIQQTRERQEKVKRTILHLGFFESPLILGILIVIFFSDQELEKMACLVSIFGILGVTLLFLIFLQLKIKFEKFGRTTIPALIVFCWIFMYMPFAGIIPASVLYLQTDWEDVKLQVYYQRIVTGAIALILASGLAISAFIFHLFFKRKDFEKKLKFISNKIIILMAKNHVKSDYVVTNLAYEGFLEQGEDIVRQTMKEGKDYIYWTKISKYDPNPQFSKMILDFKTYKKYEDKKNNKNSNQKNDFRFENLIIFKWVFFLCCCFKEKNYFSAVFPQDQQMLDLDDEDEDGSAFQRAQDEALAENLRQLKLQEDQEQLNDVPAWLKTQILNVNKIKFDDRILEPLRRYDLPQNLQVSKHLQNQFLTLIFKLFAQGSKLKYESPWIDYVMFKQFVILSGLTKFIQDEEIDKIYSKYTKGNENPILEERFSGILIQIAVQYYIYDLPEVALGKLIKNWLFPYLLWYIIPLHGFYPNEWDYVLFLIKYNEMHDTYESIMRSEIDFRKKIEKELGISSLDQQELNPDLDQNIEEERFTLKKLLKYLKEYCEKNSGNYLYFIKSFCYLEDDLNSDVLEAQNRLIKDTILKVKYETSKKKKVYKHEESPDWSFIVDQIVDEIQLGEKEWQLKKDLQFKDMTLRQNTINKIVIISKIIEIYTLGSLAFRPQIDWGISEGGLVILNLFNTEILNANFQYMFIIGFIFIVLYLVVSYNSVLRIKNKIYGESESQKIKQILSIDFFYISFVHIVHHVLGFFMIKIMVDVLACDYAVVPIVLQQDNYIKCFQKPHENYFGVSIVGIFLIYPLLTFLFSNIQYHNRSLDIKYDPTYISLQGNIRFLIAISSSFFAKEDNVIISTIFSAVLLLLLGILAKKMKPCFIKKINPLEMGGYFFSGWLHVSAAITILTKSSLGGGLTLLVGTFLIIFTSLGYFKILHDKQKERNRKKMLIRGDNEMEQQVFEEQDESSDQSKISEIEEVEIKQSQEESLEFRIWKALNEFKQKKELLGEWPEESYQFADLIKKQNQFYDDYEDDYKQQNTLKNDVSSDFMINKKEFNKIKQFDDII